MAPLSTRRFSELRPCTAGRSRLPIGALVTGDLTRGCGYRSNHSSMAHLS